MDEVINPDDEGWRGFIDGLTDPYGKGYRPGPITKYARGFDAGARAYWTEHKRWMHEITDEPF